MNPHKVVVGKVQGKRGLEVLQLLAKGVREPSKAADLHPHGEVLALYIGCGDMPFIWIALNRRGYHLGDTWGRIPAWTWIERGEQLHLLGIVNVNSKGPFDRADLGL